MIELIGNIDWFTSTCWTTEKYMHMIFYVKIEEIVVTNWIICWNNKLIVSDVLWNDKCSDCLRPILPNQLFHIVKHIKNVHFFREFCAVNEWMEFIVRVDFVFRHNIWTSINQMNEECIESFSWSFLQSNTDRPYCTENY